MRRLIDCFLYNDEEELLSIRLRLLSGCVDHFVIVYSQYTFTGLLKKIPFPFENSLFLRYREQITLVHAQDFPSGDAWAKERYSRNRMAQGIPELESSDLIMVSDIDELPRPEVVASIKASDRASELYILSLDYFNFKFNYKLVHGLHANWRGPVVVDHRRFTTPQEVRDLRNSVTLDSDFQVIRNAGWHFSYLTATDDVNGKLVSFSHQEKEIQSRRLSVRMMMDSRMGFFDHIHPGSVWAFVDLRELGCEKLEELVSDFPAYISTQQIDDKSYIRNRVAESVERMMNSERGKVIRWCTADELVSELLRRLKNRVGRLTYRIKF